MLTKISKEGNHIIWPFFLTQTYQASPLSCIQTLLCSSFHIIMDDDPVISYKASPNFLMSGDDSQKYKEMVTSRHDMFLESLLPSGSYTKLYSYTHLLSGFALHTSSQEAVETLHNARGVRIIQEDMKMEKMTVHTPDYLGISNGVWPILGGAENAGEGIVIGLIDTGINPNHPSFNNQRSAKSSSLGKFRGKCQPGDNFPLTSCNGKIVGAQFFARAAMAAGEFNSTQDYASPFDADGHGSHTASTAAGNYRVATLSNGYNYGYASGMAPAAHIAIYKAVYSFGGYMSDVVAAVDKAVEDGVDILNLSIGPSEVPPGPASFLNILEMELLLASKAGVVVVQAVGNGGPDSSSILSFSPWITSVAASTTDRKYNHSLVLGSDEIFSGGGLSPPTEDEIFYPLAAAEDICNRNASFLVVQNCQQAEPFIPSLARGKIIICTYTSDFTFTPTTINSVVDTIRRIRAAGFILAMDRSLDSQPIGDVAIALRIPGIIFSSKDASEALWRYYDDNTFRGMDGNVASFAATGRIEDGRRAVYTGLGPVVASYSSRGPDINNVLMQTADVLKPNIMAPGSSIWAAWTPKSNNNQYIQGEDFAIISGTSMAAPHISGVAAFIKQQHPDWSPAAITSAMMTTADRTDTTGILLQAQRSEETTTATPFDCGAGFVNPARALDPGLVLDIEYKNYIQFLCAVPGVDEESVRRAVGIGCPSSKTDWCSDLNTASVTVANLVGMRKVFRRVTNVAGKEERYEVTVREPAGVRVTVTPQVFSVGANSSRGLRIDLEATEVTNSYSFGELVMNGDQKHVVVIPMAVFVTSTLKS